MFIEFKLEKIEQKILYVKLSNALNISNDSILNSKISGVYAIFNNGICLYVGQSKNIASRLATHIKGKYATATNFYIWKIKPLELDHNEKSLMALFKPIENIAIDMDYKFPVEFAQSKMFADFHFRIINNNTITIVDDSEFSYLSEKLSIFQERLGTENNYPIMRKLFNDTVAPTRIPEKYFDCICEMKKDIVCQ